MIPEKTRNVHIVAPVVCILGMVLLLYWHTALGITLNPAIILRSIAFPAADNAAEMLLHYFRLPRTLAAIVAGACLAAAGAVFQAATRNPLASPGILGVTAGAQLCVAVTATVPIVATVIPPVMTATTGGLAAGCVTWMVSKGSRAEPVRIALSGMAISLMAGALASALALMDETRGANLHLWGGGSLVQSSWYAPLGALAGFLPSLGLMLLLSRHFDILALGDDTARMLGQNLVLIRGAALIIGVWVSAVAVTLAGPVVFVGLVAPNIMRMMGISRHILLIPLSIVAGIMLTLGADIIVLQMSATSVELPVGVPLAIVGAPFLILLAWRHARDTYSVTQKETRRQNERGFRKVSALALLFILLFIICIVALASGNRFVGPHELWTALNQTAPDGTRHILELRLVRILGAAISGCLLGLSGLLLQGVIRNPLASPELIGVTQTSGFSAVLVILIFPQLGVAGIQTAAVMGGLSAATFVGLLGLRHHLAPSALALMGLGLAAIASAGATALVIGGGFQASQAATWLAGSIYGIKSMDVIYLAVILFICGPLSYALLSVTDIIAMGRPKALSLGLSMREAEWGHLLLGATCASFVASVLGPVSFIGLMAPHAAKRIFSGRYRELLFPTMIIGASLMVLADCLGRTVLAPLEIPVGLMTAILGAPFILFILKRE